VALAALIDKAAHKASDRNEVLGYKVKLYGRLRRTLNGKADTASRAHG
jgi:hypothetical protein